MEGNSEASGGKPAGSRTKTPGIPTSTRLQRNLAEKERRDKLNGFISELATLVPMVSNASKPLDKVSILRLAAAEMRLNFSCLNPKRFKSKPLTLPPAIISSLDLIEKTTGGFIIATTLTGLIVFCSRSIEDYLGYQNIDVMGNKVVKYIYEDDIKYFEAKVNSVVNSLKKGSKKKSKVIKAHMLQKPLPRSNESSRPRSMIFKISVHQNDSTESGFNGKGSQTSSTLKKTRPPKDFGYSAVVLMFIEPVRLEPEIDITYIDSNQDVYFTRHGLQGEIIYADQRISSITGYMPHDVQGTSAYQYICSSDVPIALFAQKAMFTSNDGKGVIVYRLRIRDMRFIYLQSSGQIAYKESSNEISHFVCFNRLLSEEEGSQELKKFQQRYAPQIMAAKMLQVKQNDANGQLQNTDLVLEQAFSMIHSSAVKDSSTPVSQTSPFECAKDPPEDASASSDQKTSSEGFVSSPSSIMAPSSVHSSEGHSIISPVSNGRSSSVGSDYSGYVSEQVKTPEKRSPRTDCNPYTASPYHTVNNIRNEKDFCQEPRESTASVNNGYDHPLIIDKARQPKSNGNGLCRIQQSGSCVSNNSPNKIMHSVNAYSSSQSSILVNGSSEETLNDHRMDLIFDHAVLPKNTSFKFINTAPSSSYTVQSNGILPGANGEQNEYVKYNGQTSYTQPTAENHKFLTPQNNLQLPVTHLAVQNTLCNQQMNFNGEQISQNNLSHLNDISSFPGMCEAPFVSSLSKNRLSVISNPNDAVDYNPNISSYHEYGSYSNSHLPSSVSSYNCGANRGIEYNGVNMLDTKRFDANPCQTNGLHEPVPSRNVITGFPSMDTFDSMDTSVEMTGVNETPEKILGKPMDIGDSFSTVVNVKPILTAYHNGSSDVFSSDSHVQPLDWNGAGVHSHLNETVDLTMNKELYRELDLFFQNLPQSRTSGDASITAAVSEFPVGSSSYPQNSISSSRAKTNYHQ